MEEQEQTQIFNIGDKVVLKGRNEIRKELQGTIGCSAEMLDMAGSEQVIVSVNTHYRNDLVLYGIRASFAIWYFTQNCFVQNEEEKEINEKKEIKLDVGEPTKEDIKEMISKVDIKTLKHIFGARILYEQKIIPLIDDKKIYKILERWAKAKFRFYVLLGRKLKTSKKIELEKDNNEIRNFLCDLKRKFPLYAEQIGCFSLTSWRENKYYGEDDYLNTHPKVKNGMKITRILALYGNEDLNMEVSKLYQTKNEANLNISIDPNDFLTTSINKAWRSCHNFIDGEYRNAGYSLMLDETSLVNYIAKDKNVTYTYDGINFEWNNKSWRQMTYISKTNSRMIFSLQYPYSDDKISSQIREIYENLMSKQLGVENSWTISNNMNASIDYYNMYNDIGRIGCRSVINKFDKNKECRIVTGTFSLPKINDLRMNIIDEGDYIWN